MTTPRHRPPRLTRLAGAIRPFYFITFNTHRRMPLLACDEIHARFLQFSMEAVRRGVCVGRYVIMPDHMHLFVVMPPDGMTLTRWVQSLKSVLGKTLLGLGHDKPHWQEGFFDHVLRSGESYSEKWEYVRLNPERKGLVARSEDWPYQGEVEAIKF
jgi:putative transposase